MATLIATGLSIAWWLRAFVTPTVKRLTLNVENPYTKAKHSSFNQH